MGGGSGQQAAGAGRRAPWGRPATQPGTLSVTARPRQTVAGLYSFVAGLTLAVAGLLQNVAGPSFFVTGLYSFVTGLTLAVASLLQNVAGLCFFVAGLIFSAELRRFSVFCGLQCRRSAVFFGPATLPCRPATSSLESATFSSQTWHATSR